jgi:Protein of unknown function (DUF1097)
MAKMMKARIPTEYTGAFLAALTVLMAIPNVVKMPYEINFPAWAVFITWAGYFALGGGGPGKSLDVYKKMYPCILWGAFWGMVAGLGFLYLNPMVNGLGTTLLLDGIIIFLVNQPILWGGSMTRIFSTTPASFFGFATFFATYFGGFGFEANFIYAAFLSGVICNFLGPIWGYLQVYLSFPVEVEVPGA